MPQEKQNAVVTAAFLAFGANGYKKASVSDIAAAAGISKSMVFYYFGTKKELYKYLLKVCVDATIEAMKERYDPSITDFFDRMRLVAGIKFSVLEKHPGMLAFLETACFETDERVKEDIKAVIAWGEELRDSLAMDNMDLAKFKIGVDPALVMKILDYFSQGYINTLQKSQDINVDEAQKEVDECLTLLKTNFYKEESR